MAALLAFGLGLAGVARADERVLNVANWNDYIGPNVVPAFTAATGIEVHYDTYDGNETLEAKLLAGKSGYDIVVPTLTPFLARGIKAGLYAKIDRSRLKNWSNLDPALLKVMAKYDPGNEHAIPWNVGAVAIAYNVQKIKALAPDAPVDSWAMVFDPAWAARFKGCGIEILDSPTDILPVVYKYLGRDPNSEAAEDLKAAAEAMAAIRPHLRKFESQGYINDLANGDACLAVGYSTDIVIAANRAREAGRPFTIALVLPREGTLTYMDTVAIPADAPHYDAALAWLDHVMKPEIMADTTNLVGGRSGNLAALPFVKAEIRNNPGLYPPPEVERRLFTLDVASKDFDRQRVRAWTRIKTGK